MSVMDEVADARPKVGVKARVEALAARLFAPVGAVTHRRIHFVLLALMVAAFLFTRNIGPADNGDYSRSSFEYSSAPVGFTANWPEPMGSPEWKQRFFNYWIPEWKLDWPHTPIVYSSATWFWFPGVLLSALFYSPNVILLPIVSLPGLLLLLSGYWLILRWIAKQNQPLLYVVLGLPALLVLTDVNYVAYLNTWYQEGPALVFLVLVVLALAWYLQTRSEFALCAVALATLAVATAKASYAYFPIAVFAVCIGLADGWKKKAINLTLLAIISILAYVFLPATPLMRQINAGQSLFNGVLRFSDYADTHLQQLGIVESEQCVGKDIASSTGDQCFQKNLDKMTFYSVARVLIAEPRIGIRLLHFATANMQTMRLDYVGYYAEHDSRAGIGNAPPAAFTLWSQLKAFVFPRGNWLFVALTVLAAISLWFMRFESTKLFGGLAMMAVIGCLADMSVAVIGNGASDSVKHLFLANVLFDVALIASLGGLVSLGYTRRAQLFVWNKNQHQRHPSQRM